MASAFKRFFTHGMTCILLGVSVPATASADEVQPANNPVNGYVALLSNYIGRGLAQSVGEPAFQAELNYDDGSDGFYAGVSASSINWIDQLYPGSSVSMELDGWIGYRITFADNWTFKGGVLRLQFPGHYAAQVVRPDSTEAFAYLGWRFVSAKINYSITDSFGTPDSRGSWYLDVSASLPLGDAWRAGAHVGRKHAAGTNPTSGLRNDRNSYTDYKISVTRYLTKTISADLAYSWTNADPALYTLGDYNVAGHHVRLALQKDF